MNKEAEKRYLELQNEEEKLTFTAFSRSDALNLGLILNEKSKRYPDPVGIEITIIGLLVFRFFADGVRADTALWLQRKRRSVELMQMSTLRFRYWLEMKDKTLEDRKINPNDFADVGGGYPIMLNGSGMIGSICISGLPNHFDDHDLLVESISQLLEGKG